MSIRTYNNGPLPDFLAERAVFAANEFALPRAEALHYLKWCHEQGHTVYGWDVWVPVPEGIIALLSGFEGDFEQSYATLLHADFSDEEKKYGREVVFNFTIEEGTP